MRIGAGERGQRPRSRGPWARRVVLILAVLALPIMGSAAVLLAGIAFYKSIRPTLLDLTGEARFEASR